MVSLEHHQAADLPGTSPAVVRMDIHDLLLNGFCRLKSADVRLAEIGYLCCRMHRDRSPQRGEFACKQVQERRFSLTVLADDRNAVFFAYGKAELSDEKVGRVKTEGDLSYNFV